MTCNICVKEIVGDAWCLTFGYGTSGRPIHHECGIRRIAELDREAAISSYELRIPFQRPNVNLIRYYPPYTAD